MDDPDRRPIIVVVGPCASGKSTLVDRLRASGYDAHSVAQEHSAVRDLWKRRDPDVLIALDVSLEEIRSRRGPHWLESVYERQHERLASAYAAATMVIDSVEHDADAVFDLVRRYLGEMGDDLR